MNKNYVTSEADHPAPYMSHKAEPIQAYGAKALRSIGILHKSLGARYSPNAALCQGEAHLST